MTVAVLVIAVVFGIVLNLGGAGSGRGSRRTRAGVDRDTRDIVLYGAPVKHRD